MKFKFMESACSLIAIISIAAFDFFVSDAVCIPVKMHSENIIE